MNEYMNEYMKRAEEIQWIDGLMNSEWTNMWMNVTLRGRI